ncbi:biorientation of chromosomes in cell division protein 1-like 1 isoform X2 [Brassica rapa]|uniref:Calmodulin-binding domain-containing protein n=2 Tax=Brassica campestris TaxID=3711 RepID=M4CP17_BRACM|nr:biorientation of chromosomes in cell division protein 1-like 1 isoform X2 [Brassica rapa]
MAEENISQVKEMIPDENCCFVLPPPPPAAVSNGNVNMRRYSTGALDKRVPPGGKAQLQTRYRGNQTSSTHDLCKHGKRREDELVIKPWMLVKNKKVEGGGGLVKNETLSVVRKSLVSVSKTEKSLNVAKRDATAAVVSEVVKSDGLRAKRSETKSTTTTTPSDSAVGVRMVKKTNVDVKKVSKSSREDVLKNIKDKEKKTKIDDVLEKKVSRIMEKKSSKEDLLKNVKRKEKTEIDEPVRCDDVVEKTLYVVESSIEEKKKKKRIGSVKSETLKRSDPRPPIRQFTSRSKTGLSEKKESGSPTLVANAKTEIKKRIGLKPKAIPPPGPPTRPVSFKKGKVLEPKTEDLTLTSIKFKKRVVQEPKLRSDVNKNKNNLKDKGEGVGKMSYNSGEGIREKVVLRHRKVEEKKKMGTLFNNVIEETVNKLGEERKSRVKALVGAFETVISLQDNDKTSLLKKKNIQNKSTSSQVVEG